MGAFGAEYKDMVAFLILILVIIFRPMACSVSKSPRRLRRIP